MNKAGENNFFTNFIGFNSSMSKFAFSIIVLLIKLRPMFVTKVGTFIDFFIKS